MKKNVLVLVSMLFTFCAILGGIGINTLGIFKNPDININIKSMIAIGSMAAVGMLYLSFVMAVSLNEIVEKLEAMQK